MLVFAPLVVLAILVATLRTGRRRGDATLREDVLAATLLLGVVVALGTQLLSAFDAVSRSAVTGFWLVAIAAAGAALAWRWQRHGRPARLSVPRPAVVDGVLIGGVATIALLLFVVAWLSPPQSSDSIGYHMSRIMHWIQGRSLAHYPTPDAPQLFEPPLAEILRLHLYLLAGGDRAGCLLQWFAAMGALAAASLVARDLGGGRRAQIFAAVFAVTLPIGITQASSGKNGWVEALWLLSLVHFSQPTARGEREDAPAGNVLAAFAALGLELMTKITGWLFAAPVFVVAGLRLLRRKPAARRGLVAPVVAGAVLAGALVVPYLARNVSVYGHPLVDPIFRIKSGLEHVTPAVAVSNVVRNASFQLGTPSIAVNEALTNAVVRVHRLLGVDPFDPQTSQFGPFRIRPPAFVEESVFSPLHLLLVFGTGFALLVSRRARAGSSRIVYLAMLVAGYLLFCATVKWQPAGCRLLMPLLVLAAPLVAVVVTDVLRGRVVPAVAAILFVACVPYVLWTYARPLSFEKGKGILVTPRADLYFARVPWLRRPYREVARVVRESHIRNLGVLFTDSGHPEYLLWMLLQDADPPVRVENVAVKDASGRLALEPPFRDFRPELVVVFATDVLNPRFEPEIQAAGARFDFVRSAGSAGFYAPSPDGS